MSDEAKPEDEPLGVYQLKKAITAHGETVDELPIYDISGKDMRKLKGLNLQMIDYPMMMKHIEVACRIPPSSVDQMCGADVTACSAMVFDFLENGPTTGKTATPK